MTDCTKLVAALRGCKDIEFCTECPRMGNGFTEYCNIREDAADAIEALQAEEKRRKENCEKCADAARRVITDLQGIIADLRAQLPKRGKWVGVSPMVDTVQCSVCGDQLFSEELETPYCPYCGAKMEAQDGK